MGIEGKCFYTHSTILNMNHMIYFGALVIFSF